MKLFISLLFAAAVITGGIWFKSSSPARCAEIRPGDSVFILTGDPRRIPAGLKIQEKFPETKLYIIGAGGHPMPDASPEKIVVEQSSKTTYENALAIRKIARREHLRRLVLLTSVDHMNRAMLLASRELPRVEIAPCPVPLHGTQAPRRLERWAIEYAKYLGTLAGLHKGI
jgi:hypothetical protein